MTLRETQSHFVLMLGMLIKFAYQHGYELTLGEGYVSSGTGHMKGSLHYIKLAQDLNLFKDGEYLTETKDYEELGKYWELLGGAWGGRFGDGNHFSFPWGGRK